MKKYMSAIFSFLIIFSVFGTLQGQRKRSNHIPDSERFSAGVIIGYNSSQIDGDYFTGFDKFGVTGGIRGITRLTPRLDFNIEMLFSKKGSKIQQGRLLTGSNQEKSRIVDLSYMDAPFFFKWLLKEEPSYWHIELGGIYSRLINTNITEKISDGAREFVYEEVASDFDKDDISTLFGLGYSWEGGIALNFRYVLGVKKFYQNDNYIAPGFGSPLPDSVEFLRNYYYSLNFSYTIFQRQSSKKKKKSRR